MLYGKEIANDEKINSCFIHVIDFQIILRILHIFCDLTEPRSNSYILLTLTCIIISPFLNEK